MMRKMHDMTVVYAPSVIPRHPRYMKTTAAVSNSVAMNEPSTFIDAPWGRLRYEALVLRYE